jgi:hypothetical protein
MTVLRRGGTARPASVEAARKARPGIRTRDSRRGRSLTRTSPGEAPACPDRTWPPAAPAETYLSKPDNCEAALGKAGASHEGSRSLIGRRVSLRGVASRVRAFDFGKTVEGPGSNARAIVVERPVCVRRIACVGRRCLRIRRIVSSRNNWRMLEQARRIPVFRSQRGGRRQRG